MPIRLIDLKKDRRTCIVTWEGETAEIVYRPSAYTPETEDEMRQAFESGRPANGLAMILASTLVEWDILDEDGNKLPPTLELMRKLSNGFLVAVSNAIVEDQNTEREDRKNSGGGSLHKAS